MRFVPCPRLWFALSVSLALMLLAAPKMAGQGGEPLYFAIRGVTVVPVSSGRIENATVIISRGVITAVGKDARIPEEAWVIDGKGLTVYPGLFDAFTDVGLPAPPSPPSGGDAAARAPQPISRGPEDRPGSTPWRDAAGEANLSDKRIETWRSAGFTTVVSVPKGGIFPGQAALLDLAGERNGDLVVKAPVAIPISLQPVGNFANFPGSLMGTLGYVHQVWLDTDWSTKAEALYEKSPRGIARPRYDRTDTALAQALEDHAVVLIPANTSLQIRRAFELVNVWHVNGVIYGGQMSYAVADEIAVKKLPVLVDLKWPEADKEGDPGAVASLRTLRFRDRAPSSPAALARAAVKFGFYSGGITAPKDILKAAKKAIDAGLAPDAAIRALTLSPAEIFGVSDRLGSIENGKIANLVVTDGDLFNEKTKVKYVFVDGRRFEIREPEKPKEPPKGDLTGKWKLAYTTSDGPEESTADLTMTSDGSLSGTISGKRGTYNLISGSLSVDKFNFLINILLNEIPTDVTFSGTFDGTSMKGTISVQGTELDFTGTRPGALTAASNPSANETGAAQ